MRQWYNFGCGFGAAVPQGGLMGAQSHNQKNHRGVFRERLETHVDAESSWKENKKNTMLPVCSGAKMAPQVSQCEPEALHMLGAARIV